MNVVKNCLAGNEDAIPPNATNSEGFDFTRFRSIFLPDTAFQNAKFNDILNEHW